MVTARMSFVHCILSLEVAETNLLMRGFLEVYKIIITVRFANLLVHREVSGNLCGLGDLDTKKEEKGATNTIK